MNAECGICKDYFVNYSNLCAVPCGHVFHRHCISSWFEMGTLTCPQCRKPAKKNSSLKLYFDLVETDNAVEDIAVIKGQKDRLVQELEGKDAELCRLRKKAADAEARAKTLKETVKDYENMSRVLQNQVEAYTDQAKVLAETKRLLKEKDKMVEMCKTKLERFKGVQALSLPYQDESNIREIGKDLSKNDLINLICASKRDQKKLLDSESSLAESLRTVSHQNLVLNKKLDQAESEIRILQQVTDGFKKMRQHEPNVSSSFGDESALLWDDSNKSPMFTPPKSGHNQQINTPRLSSHNIKITSEPNPSLKRPRIEVGNRLMPKNKPVLAQREFYNGFGGSSRLDLFPQAKLRTCKVLTHRKK